MVQVFDQFKRPLRNLRISVTDKCNLRCEYCMPEEDYVWLDREQLLSFEEIVELGRIFADLGVEKIRLTGGEPLIRRDLDKLIRMLSENARIRDLALTTNGILLADCASALKEAGLHRVTVSLDTLRPDRFLALTRRDDHRHVLGGIAAAREAGFPSVKINTVVIRGYNDDELSDLISYGREIGAEIRFIEYMDVGGATHWSMNQVFSRKEILTELEKRFGAIQLVNDDASAPADRYALPDGTVFGIISSTTEPFCRNCDRGRITADGLWLLCLYAQEGVDLKRMIRDGASSEEISERISSVWRRRTDRGAEERRTLAYRSVLYQLGELKRDPHREMHTRGG